MYGTLTFFVTNNKNTVCQIKLHGSNAFNDHCYLDTTHSGPQLKQQIKFTALVYEHIVTAGGNA